MRLDPSRLRMSAVSPRGRKAIYGCLIAFILYSAAGFLAVPALVRPRLVQALSNAIGRKVVINKMSFNPYVISTNINGIIIFNKAGKEPSLAFENLYLNLEIFSVLKQALIIREVALDRLKVRVERNEDRTYDFSDILDRLAARPKTEEKPFLYSVNNIRIREGSVEFRDQPKKTRHEITDINVSIPFLSNVPYDIDTYVQPAFAAKVNGTPFVLKGKTKPFSESLETSFDVNIDRFNIPYYWEYVADMFRFRVTSGEVSAKGVVAFIQSKDRPPAVSYVGTFALGGLKVEERDGAPLVSLERLDVGIDNSDFVGRRIAFSRISLRSPGVSLRRNEKGRLSVQDLFAGGGSKSPPPGPSGAGKEFVVSAGEIEMTGGTVRFEDRAVSKPFRTTLKDMALAVRGFGNVPGHRSSVAFSAATEAGETVAVKADVTVVPRAAEGTLEVKGVPLARYAPYYGGKVLFDVRDGTAGLATRFRYAAQERGTEVVLSGLEATLTSLRLSKSDEPAPFLTVPEAAVRDASLDLARKEAGFGLFETRGGRLVLHRPKGGTWNLAGLLPPSPEGNAEGAGGPKDPAAGKPWRIRAGRIDVGNYLLKVEDQANADPVAIDVGRISFKGGNLDTGRSAPGRVAFKATIGGGSVEARGSLRPAPLAADIAVAIASVDIVPLQPYFTEKMRILLTGGKVSARGSVSLDRPEGGALRAGFRGEASVTGFSSVDKEKSDDFIEFASLAFTGIDAGYNPTRLSVDGIALSDFFVRAVIRPDGTANLQGIYVGGEGGVSGGEGKAPAPAEARAAATDNVAAADNTTVVPVRIGTVTLQGGEILFSDRHIKPSFTAQIKEVGGRISGLSSDRLRQADVDLRGNLGAGSPLSITGTVNPLARDLFVDLKVSFKDIDLSPMSPYSGRYAGYGIEKGKLSLNLQYHIVAKKLESQNKVFLDQFTFGEKVDSPEATKLPVKLAVALLKDRNGAIELDLPVSGEVDDPQFSVGKIVVKIIVNLLVKAATSPFALLGALFGGGEELSYMEFDPGSASLGEPSARKVDTLVKALSDRPGLRLEIEGHADPEGDREGLRENVFRRKIAAQKLRDATSKGSAAPSIDNVAVTPAEYPVYLKKAYKAEKFPKPRNIIGIAKDLPVPEMEKLMRAHIEVTVDDLKNLAEERARKVKDAILASGKVAPERVFLVEPKALAPEKKEKVSDRRVDFRLR